MLPGNAGPDVLSPDPVLVNIFDTDLPLHHRTAARPEFYPDFLAPAHGEGKLGTNIKADPAHGHVIETDFRLPGISGDDPGGPIGHFAPFFTVVDVVSGRFTASAAEDSAPGIGRHFKVGGSGTAWTSGFDHSTRNIDRFYILTHEFPLFEKRVCALV